MQTYKVVVSELAKTDLQDIVAYISDAESAVRAKHVESEMKRLACFPTAYPKDKCR